MIGSTRSLRVFAYTAPADLRRGYDGLIALVASELARDPISGDCYLFVNRTRTRTKILMWDGTGLIVFQKRLEQGRFASLWRKRKTEPLELTMTELALFIEGSRLVGRKRLSPARFHPRSIEP